MIRALLYGAGFTVVALTSTVILGEGHGPAFGLAPPTLGQGQWSSDTMAMSFTTEESTSFMLREMIGYGITEDIQAIVGFPLSPTISELDSPPRTRAGSMMWGMGGDIEASLLWRFQREAPGIGSRFETTIMGGGTLPTEHERGGLDVGPSLGAAVVTGYASRSIYGWLGGGYHYYFRQGDDRLAELPFASAVFGWRPPMFQEDYPSPDWRIFIESLAEFPQRSERDGIKGRDSGGEKVMIGPSVLGLYGRWGVEAGLLFPAYQRLNGKQPEERVRGKLVFTFWF